MSSETVDKKPAIPTKSSMEILSELFSTFDAEPPLIIKKEKSEESTRKHKKSKKKHKHKDKKHKKKDKKKKRSDSSSSDESEIDLAQILIKQEKGTTEKKIKIEGTDLAYNLKSKDKNLEDCKSSVAEKIRSKVKAEVAEDGEISDSQTSTSDKDTKTSKKHKKHKTSSKKRSRSSSRDESEKKLKSEDLRNKLKHERTHSRSSDKDRYGYSSKNDFYRRGDEHRNRDKSDYRSRSRERYKNSDDYKTSRSRDTSFYKDDGFYKSRDHNDKDRYRGYDRDRRYRPNSRERESSKFDKKKLLEIARKNAITMMKSGSLPGALTLGPQAQEKVIAAIKSGGKTVEELTDFCKTLSTKEELGELSSLSEKEDSDSETDKLFHHPFQIKDRPTSITMNIKNSVPLPLKSSMERTSELRIQFPVSSGQQHRKEEEWLPVLPRPEKKVEEKVKATVVKPVPPSNIPLPLEQPPLPPELPEIPIMQAPEPVPVVIAPLAPPVVPQPFSALEPAVDIGSIVSQRLTAMRKLQENPHDVQALSQMYKSNKEMQFWATSKQQPGQFTGSTGAQILSQAQLSSGYQAWAKKDQLQTAAPVSGGMGMHLLQKMGWKPGEGLGKEKTGTLEPLLLEVKLDKKGLVANEEQKGKVKKQKGPANLKNLQGKHPVSLLGEYASKRKLGAPQYVLEFECGPDHKKNFLFKVILNGCEYKPNVASNNKKEAKAAAATICLQAIGLLPS